jgi:cell division protein FtsB
MNPRLLTAALLIILLLLQWPVWFGKGGWFKVWERERELATVERANEERRLRNTAMEADVRDLKDGTGAIEERARQELGMIKKGEVFVQVLPADKALTAPGAQSTPAKPSAAASIPTPAASPAAR